LPPLTIELLQGAEDSGLLLDANERDAVLVDVAPGEVRWLPTVTATSNREPVPRAPQAWLDTVLLMFASGAVGAITFDAWGLIKRTAARIIARQSAKAYALRPDVFVVIHDGDDTVAIRVLLGKFPEGSTEQDVIARFGAAIDEADWTELRRKLDELRDQAPSPTKLYEAIYGGGGWVVNTHRTLATLGAGAPRRAGITFHDESRITLTDSRHADI
jgi:hypothetical protein